MIKNVQRSVKRSYLGAWFYLITYLSVVLIQGILLYLIFQVVWPVTVIEWKTTPAKVRHSPPAVPGGQFRYILNYCKYVDVPSLVARAYEGKGVEGLASYSQLPLVMSSLPMGCHEIELVETVPFGLPPGFYVLRLTRYFEVNRFRTEISHIATEPFEVIVPAKPAR
jgi:hypothetical protein